MWGRKERGEKVDRHKKEQQGPIWRKIHLKNLKMRAKDGRIEEGHYLRERAAPGGLTNLCRNFRDRYFFSVLTQR